MTSSDWSPAAQCSRRDLLWPILRRRARPFFTEDGTFREPESGRETPDHRVPPKIATVMLCGDDADRALGNAILRRNVIKIGACSFSTDHALALWHAAGEQIEPDIRQRLLDQFAQGLQTYNVRDLQHHGYNDNHVTMATSSLILGGELTDQQWAVDQGRYNLLNLRDTLLRRGLIHEANDCYFWHTMYSTAMVARWAKDETCRELAAKAEARLWAEHAAFYHPNLGRKIGPSARDYTKHRLYPVGDAMPLWFVLGDRAHVPAMPPALLVGEDPVNRPFTWSGQTEFDRIWLLGYCARVTAHHYVVPDSIAALFFNRDYPHTISATNETGHFEEGYYVDHPEGEGRTLHHLNAIPFPAQEHTLYTYMEEDWGMGTGDGRMIGGCPNNTWQLSYRKARPLTHTWDQGNWWCSFVINDKPPVEDVVFEFAPPQQATGATAHFHFQCATRPQQHVHWSEMGRFAALQHQRTSIMLYRPRPVETWQTTSLATVLCYPLLWRNAIDELWLGDTRVEDWDGESADVCDIFVKDGPMYIAFKPLICGALPAPYRVKAERRAGWGLIHLLSFSGEALDLSEEARLSQIGGGFVCEVATESDFPSLAAFKAWFRQGRVLDETHFWMRQVRWQRPGLNLGLRYDVWNDHIMWRMVNGRSMPQPQFECTGLDNNQLPWLTEDVSDWDHFDWAVAQAARPLAPHCQEPKHFAR